MGASRTPVVVIVLHIADCRDADLLHVGHAADRVRLRPCRIQRGKKHAGEDGDDGNYHEELHKREFAEPTFEPVNSFSGLISSVLSYLFLFIIALYCPASLFIIQQNDEKGKRETAKSYANLMQKILFLFCSSAGFSDRRTFAFSRSPDLGI